ncbi:unnamed protein product [Calypogeia fissa]
MPACSHCSQVISCKACAEQHLPVFSVPRERVQSIDACFDCSEKLKRNLKEKTKTINELKKKVTCLEKELLFIRRVNPEPGSDRFKGDVSFIVQGTSTDPEIVIQAHQFVLASKSSVFRNIFDPGMHENLPATIHVYDTSAAVLRAMINFCYTAEISYNDKVTPEDVLRVAHKYGIQELKAHAETFLVQRITQDNLVDTIKISHKLNSAVVKEAALKFFESHFADVKSFVIDSLVDNS